jgi:hypothetical protein
VSTVTDDVVANCGDARTGTLHPPNTDAVLEAIGAVALGQG